jgi:23S rRNA (guanosine2251-2'-O)-methyltransferase
MVLYGKNSVLERLRADPRSIKRLLIQEDFSHPDIEKLAKSKRIPVKRLSLNGLNKIKQAEGLQGIIAEVDNFKYSAFDNLLNAPKDKQRVPIFLDRVFDPQNLGAIIRSTACFSGFSIIIPRFKACEVNETVLHVASGGENYVPLSRVANLSNAVISARQQGYWIIGAVPDNDAKDINKVSLPFPLALVLGSEGEGIRYGVSKHLDMKINIPMKGAKLSLNVAIACAILCHEISKQKEKHLLSPQ